MQITKICLENLCNPHNLRAIIVRIKKELDNQTFKIFKKSCNRYSRVLYKNLRHLHNLRDILSANPWMKKESVHQQLKKYEFTP